MDSEQSEGDEASVGAPSDIKNLTEDAQLTVLPEISKKRYEYVYETFQKWQKERNTSSLDENLLLEYFVELSKTYKPSTLWSYFSMLRAMLEHHNQVKIETYESLIAFLKKQAKGYQCKKSMVFSTCELNKFIEEAPDDKYLLSKVIAIFSIHGITSNNELVNMDVSHVEYGDDAINVKIPSTKNHAPKTYYRFTIDGDFANIVRKYERLRPKDIKLTRYFINYQRGRCTRQPVGINKFASTPKQIAKFLKLEDAAKYTGHSFRRTSAVKEAEGSRKGSNRSKKEELRISSAMEKDESQDSATDCEASSSAPTTVIIKSEPPELSELSEPSVVVTEPHIEERVEDNTRIINIYNMLNQGNLQNSLGGASFNMSNCNIVINIINSDTNNK